MIRMFIVTVALVALAGAVTIRMKDAPYITYLHGDRQGALEGLTRKARTGDGFAAYLLGANEEPDPRRAQDLLLTAVSSGEDRAISLFLRIAASHGVCEPTMSLLEVLARTRDVGAAVALGDLARDGQCGPQDITRAADYYEGAARLEPVFEHRLETLPPLGPNSFVRVLPERYDLNPKDVRQKFMAAAPALLVPHVQALLNDQSGEK